MAVTHIPARVVRKEGPALLQWSRNTRHVAEAGECTVPMTTTYFLIETLTFASRFWDGRPQCVLKVVPELFGMGHPWSSVSAHECMPITSERSSAGLALINNVLVRVWVADADDECKRSLPILYENG